jgi:glycosyltransferase involved in cell wall biosynthesis
VPVRDGRALAERIETLDADRGRLAEFSAAARTRALEFPWSAYRRALVSLIEEWDRTGWA